MPSDDDSLDAILDSRFNSSVQVGDDPGESLVEALMELDALLDGTGEVGVLRVDKLEVEVDPDGKVRGRVGAGDGDDEGVGREGSDEPWG